MAEDRKVHRLNVTFAPSTYDALEELSKIKAKSKGEVIRDAIALTKYIEETRLKGGHILIEVDGKIREIVPL